MLKFLITQIVFTIQMASALPLDHEKIRAHWQDVTAERLWNAVRVRVMNAEYDDPMKDVLKVNRSGDLLGISPRKYTEWRHGRAVITVEEGFRVARALKAAPWFLLGWDVLYEIYRPEIVSPTEASDRFEVRPEVLAAIRSPTFREMVREGVRGWKSRGHWRLPNHSFEPAPCAANLTIPEMIEALAARGFRVSKASGD